MSGELALVAAVAGAIAGQVLTRWRRALLERGRAEGLELARPVVNRLRSRLGWVPLGPPNTRGGVPVPEVLELGDVERPYYTRELSGFWPRSAR